MDSEFNKSYTLNVLATPNSQTLFNDSEAKTTVKRFFFIYFYN